VRDLPAAAQAANWQRTELYFGLRISGGGEVSEEAWRAFVGSEICPRFPSGFTLFEAIGNWRSPTGELTAEPSRVLVILHSEGERDGIAIEAIRAAYKSTFHQGSVLRTDAPAKVSF
jgi:hypothetical protein